MKRHTKLIAALAALSASLVAGQAAAVTVVGATRIEITSAIPDWIQIAEVEAFNFSAVNVAAAANGGTASATGSAFGGLPGGAIDGNANTTFGSHFFHSDTPNFGEMLTINLGSASTLSSLRIVGRDELRGRDVWNVSIFNGANAILFLGQLDARTTLGSQAIATFDAPPPTGAIPEPSTWALMILGFGATGAAIRSRRRVPASTC
jgi:hypothetical protein